MRWSLAAVACTIVALPGCFSCGDEVSAAWSEPGLPAWLRASGEAGGFQAVPADPGFALGPRMQAAVPPGAALAEVGLAPRGVIVALTPGQVRLEGPTSIAETELRAALHDVVDAVHAGPAEDRTRLVALILDEWALAAADAGSRQFHAIEVPVADPWDFERLPGTPGWTSAGTPGMRVAMVGSWRLVLSLPTWEREGLVADSLGQVSFHGSDAVDEAALQAQLRRGLPGFGWTFTEFQMQRSHC